MIAVKNKIISLIMLAVASVLLFTAGFYSLAWFSDVFSSGNVGFGAGKLGDNTLEIARIIHPSNTTNMPEESARRYYPCENMQIEADSLPVQNGESYTVALEQMTFGIIDNIALLKPDNVVYLRLTVPKENGNTVSLKLYYNFDADGNFVDIYRNEYDTDGETVLGQVKITEADTLEDGTGVLEAFQGVEAAEAADDCFLKYAVLLSNESYEATELSSLEFYGEGGEVASDESDTYYRFNKFDDASEGIILVNEDIASAEDNYYVYVRVEPNLSVFGHSIEYISTIMPCNVYFKVKASFDIYEGDQP